MTNLQASSGPSIRDMLSAATSAAVLCGAISGLIIYLASGANSGAVRELREKIVRLETFAKMAPRQKPGAWAPEGA